MSRIHAKISTAAAALASVLFLAGCGRDSGAPVRASGDEAGDGAEAAATNEEVKVIEPDAVKRRMRDEEYTKQLDGRLRERREIMKKLSVARGRLDKAKEAGAPEDEVKALEAEMKKILGEMKRHQAESRAIVGARIQRDLNENGQNK